jgi:hypothetical protein
MTTHPSTTTVAKTPEEQRLALEFIDDRTSQLSTTRPESDKTAERRYLEDLFMQAAGASRTVTAARNRLDKLISRFAPTANHQFQDAVAELAMSTQELLAAVAPVATERAKSIAGVLPTYTQAIFDLRRTDIDNEVRPMFEASGIGDDFEPWSEHWPKHDTDPEQEPDPA